MELLNLLAFFDQSKLCLVNKFCSVVALTNEIIPYMLEALTCLLVAELDLHYHNNLLLLSWIYINYDKLFIIINS